MACCLTAPIDYMNQSVRSGSDIQLKLMVVLFSIQLNSNKRCREHLSTHWGRVAHICVVNLTTIGSDNGLSPGRRQAIIWTNAGILLFGPLGSKQWNLNRNWYILSQENAFEIVVCEIAAILSRPQCVSTTWISLHPNFIHVCHRILR